jgi:hypothetical protein
VCLPLGRKLYFDGKCLYLREPVEIPPDGEYGGVKVEGGCITEVLPKEVPIYQAPPCEPMPGPCGGGGGGDGGSLEIDQSVSNLSKLSLSGKLLTELVAEGVAPVTVTGNGTASNPLRISASMPSASVSLMTSTPSCLEVSGSGGAMDPFDIRHKSLYAETAIGPFTLDGNGHVTGYTAPTASDGITTLSSPLKTMTVQVSGAAATVDLAPLFTEDASFEATNAIISVDMYGRITGATGGTAGPPADRWSFVVDQGWTTRDFAFETLALSKFRASYKGDFGLTKAGVFGLTAPPAGLTVTLDGQPLTTVYAVMDSNRVVGLEIYVNLEVAAGEHTLSLTTTMATPGPGTLDVSLCQ